MENFKLDRNVFNASSFENQKADALYYKSLTWKERFEIVKYLNSIAFKLVGEEEPKMDKSIFLARKNS